MTAIIVEDEQPARALLKRYLESFPEITLLGEYDNGFSGLKAINELKPDVIFLDVQMPKLTGFEMIEVLEHQPAVIFTTAYDQFAIRAFEQNAVDYLLKPFSTERFSEAINRLKVRMSGQEQLGADLQRIRQHLENSEEQIRRIVIKKAGKIHVISTDDVHYLEAQDDYVMVYTSEGRFLKQQTMKFFETHLDPEQFIRIHRSYMVNIRAIERIEPYEKTNFILILRDGSKVPVSRNGMQVLKDKLDF